MIFTASHNPAEYNGAKFCLAGAKPIDLAEIKPLAQAALDGNGPKPAAAAGTRTEEDLLSAFADHVVSFVDVDKLRPRRVVADTANGMGGLVVPAVFERLGMFELEVMYAELDGTFPNHPADPLQPANQRDLRARVVVRWLRHRARVRRRRRPGVRRRRDRHRSERLDHDGDPVGRHAAKPSRARRSCTT